MLTVLKIINYKFKLVEHRLINRITTFGLDQRKLIWKVINRQQLIIKSKIGQKLPISMFSAFLHTPGVIQICRFNFKLKLCLRLDFKCFQKPLVIE